MSGFSTIPEAIDDIKNGRPVIVTDDENRENEGDIIIAAEYASPEAINFMAAYGRGLICMPAEKKLLDKLKIEQMVEHNTDNHETAFTVSIDSVKKTPRREFPLSSVQKQ